jgi:hypothetical protein
MEEELISYPPCMEIYLIFHVSLRNRNGKELMNSFDL